jgi:hypothetical protein
VTVPQSNPFSRFMDPAVIVVGGVNFRTSERLRKETHPALLRKSRTDALTSVRSILNGAGTLTAMLFSFMACITPDPPYLFVCAAHKVS